MSSPLDETQQEFYRVRFGDRYSTVQEQPLRPSRALRRAKKGKRTARGVTDADIQVFNTQNAMIEKLLAPQTGGL